MRFGICCAPSSFGPGEDTATAIHRMVGVLQDAEADYVEFPVSIVNPEGPWEEFEKLRELLAPYPIRAEAFNCFIPAHYRITGHTVDHSRVLDYAREALDRCKELGAEVVVLGSGGARRIPDGFSPDEAREQFIKFCIGLGPIAEAAGIKIAVEPLNRAEDNLINTVRQGADICREVRHPYIQLLADFYHIQQNGESADDISKYGGYLIHTHIAHFGREAPGFGPAAEDFFPFFQSLYRAHYEGRCSFEGQLDDIENRARPLLDFLRNKKAAACPPPQF